MPEPVRPPLTPVPRPDQRPAPRPERTIPPIAPAAPPAPLPPPNPGVKKLKRRRLRRLLLAIFIPLVILIAAGLTAGWYAWALKPLDANDANHIRVTVKSGTLAPEIGKQLKDAKIIRSSVAFELYTRLSGKQNGLQAGTYAFAPNQSVQSIVDHLETGKTDEFSVTILPGQTLKDIRATLTSHGYSTTEIDAAYSAQYTNTLLSARGTQTSLEGFLFPDTYSVLSDESLQTIFGRVFEHYSSVLQDDNIEAGFAAHGLTLYQGITLASIVQKEVSGATDQAKVASVFYNRLNADIALGSDVTYIYGASLLGVTPSPSLDSPYNTRIYKGLPPTPISNPELSALEAVANPASTDYLFFLSGDDGNLYFAHTDAEHEQNIKDHCSIKCQ